MITIPSVEKEQIPLLVPILYKCGDMYSSVKSLIAFQLTVDGNILAPTGFKSGLITESAVLGPILYKEISYGNLAGWLVASELNLISNEDLEEEDLLGVPAFSKTLVLHQISENNPGILKIPSDNDFGVTSSGVSIDLGGQFDTVELRLLFAERKMFKHLPAEFSHFRLYKDSWMTIPKCAQPLVNISWEKEEYGEGLCTIRVEFVHKKEQIVDTFCSDVRRFLNPLLLNNKGVS